MDAVAVSGDESAVAITVAMTLELWYGIDGGLENYVKALRWDFWQEGGDMGAEDDPGWPEIGPRARFAQTAREEGHRQLAHLWMQDGAQKVTVTLRRDQWECILHDAETSAPAYDELAGESSDGQSREEMLASTAGCRETIVVVGAALRPRGP